MSGRGGSDGQSGSGRGGDGQGGSGRGSVGRGSAVYELLKKQKEQREAAEAAARALTLPGSGRSMPVPKPPVSAGRANLLEMARRQAAASQASSKSSSSSASSVAAGRATLLSTMKKLSEQKQAPPPVVSGDMSGVTGSLAELALDDTKSSQSELIIRHGEHGKPVNITANYIDIIFEMGKGLYQYLVKFLPDIDSRPLRNNLLNQHRALMGNAKTFDGSLLHLARKLPNDTTVVTSIHPVDQSQVQLTIIYKKHQLMTDNVPFFNVLLNRVMRSLDLVRIGRQNFHPNSAHKIPQHRLELWPGYVTAINEYEGGVKLNIDATHRVLRTDTVRDLMNDLFNKDSRNFRNLVMSEIIGTSVLTRYNNRTYRIDDISWDQNPLTTFQKGGETITLIDYYKSHWGLPIIDSKQPLLVHREKKKDTTGQTKEEIVLLIPELCYLAGLTDNIRSDFRIMRDMAKVTQVAPEQRRETICRFIQEVNNNEVARKILSDWGMKLAENTTRLKGRVFEPEQIIFGNGRMQEGSDKADWSSSAVRSPVLRTPHLHHWAILFTNRDERSSREFISMLQNVTKAMKIDVNKPQIVQLRDDKTDTYVRELRKVLSNDLEMVVVVFPTNRNDRYAAIKKLCCVEKPIASQVIIGKTISRADKLKSVTEKIALQMNCKLGGALWALKIPFDNCMICGVDVYHGGVGQGKRGSVAGFVASLDKSLTKWYSKICIQGPHQELIDLLKACLISAIKAYHEEHGRFPDRIFMYRDGVGDGQLETVTKYEVNQLLSSFSSIDQSYTPKLSVIVVQKRINTRLMAEGRQGLINPSPGTIVDTEVTRRNYYDFFLVPQSARQGTVTPTHYIVVHDGASMKVDHLQRLTYKLCHLYYNWPGTIRVPAPCQYAHKLAYLIGQSIQMEPHNELSKILYYL